MPAESMPAMLGENHVSHARHLSVLRWILVFPILPQYTVNVVVRSFIPAGSPSLYTGLKADINAERLVDM